MTNQHDTPEPRPHGVLDPAWEDELRRGQAEEGESGSVEPELEALQLLRHLREPDTLEPARLDELWRSISTEIAPTSTPWWRKAWLWWSAPALAAAAVLAVIVIQSPEQKHEDAVAREDARAERKQDQRAEAAPAPATAPAEQTIAAEGEAFSGAARGAAADDAFTATEKKRELDQFEASFQQLAPYGRRAIRGSLDDSYDDLRASLLADAKGATP